MSDAEEAIRHADPEAEQRDSRVVVETTGVGVDIIVQTYGLVKYQAGTKYFGWSNEDGVHLRADLVSDLLDGLEDVDLEGLEDSLTQLQEADRALEEAFGDG